MLKKSLHFHWAAFLIMIVAVLGCEQQMVTPNANAICADCQIDPGGGIIIRYCPDLTVYSVIAYGHTGNVIKFGVVIKNIGNATANINTTNTVGWQAYLSKNGVSRDLPACGSSFYQPLTPGQLSSPSILNCTFPASVNFNNYTAMIIDLKVPSSIVECSSANNTFVRVPIP